MLRCGADGLGLGLPMVVPKGSWLNRETAAWGAAAVAATGRTIAGLRGAFDTAKRQRATLATASQDAARRFRAANGAESLMEEIWGLWRPRLAAQALPAPVALGAPDAAAALSGPDAPRAALQWMGHAASRAVAETPSWSGQAVAQGGDEGAAAFALRQQPRQGAWQFTKPQDHEVGPIAARRGAGIVGGSRPGLSLRSARRHSPAASAR